MSRGRRVAIVGAGGAVGSRVVPLLARLADLERVTLVDPDVYEASNFASQDIEPADVGRLKVEVQARRFAARAPGVAIDVLPGRVEDAPPGRLRGDVLLACVDSRRARQAVNERARALGAPWIDAGVGALPGGGAIARVAVYGAGPDDACLECAWDERDYALLEQTYPCDAGVHVVAPSRAPAALAALAASMVAIECGALLAGERDRTGRQWLLDAPAHGAHETRFARRARCRLAEHAPWRVRRVLASVDELRLGDLVDLAAHTLGDQARLALAVEGRRFVTALTCPGCGLSLPRFGVARGAGETCASCGASLVVAGFDERERVVVGEIPPALRARPVAALGLRRGDVLRFESGADACRFELDGDAEAR